MSSHFPPSGTGATVLQHVHVHVPVHVQVQVHVHASRSASRRAGRRAFSALPFPSSVGGDRPGDRPGDPLVQVTLGGGDRRRSSRYPPVQVTLGGGDRVRVQVGERRAGPRAARGDRGGSGEQPHSITVRPPTALVWAAFSLSASLPLIAEARSLFPLAMLCSWAMSR